MVDGFLKFEMQLLAAGDLAHGVAWLAPIGIGTTAGTRLLWVTSVAFDEPRSWFQKFEMSRRTLRNNRQRCDQENEPNKIFHRHAPFADREMLWPCGGILYMRSGGLRTQ